MRLMHLMRRASFLAALAWAVKSGRKIPLPVLVIPATGPDAAIPGTFLGRPPHPQAAGRLRRLTSAAGGPQAHRPGFQVADGRVTSCTLPWFENQPLQREGA